MYFALTSSKLDYSTTHHSPHESIDAAMNDADAYPGDAAEIIRCDGLRMRIAFRDAGGEWIIERNNVCVCTWLVSKETKQCVNVAVNSMSYVRGPWESNVLGLFCAVHEHTEAVLLNDNDFNGREYVKWTMENAVERYRAVTGAPPNADVIRSLSESSIENPMKSPVIYLASTKSMQNNSKTYHPVRESIDASMKDADLFPDAAAEVIRRSDVRMRVACRDAGGEWLIEEDAVCIGFWLVSQETKQCVHAAVNSMSYVRGPWDSNVLGLFCSAPEHRGAVLLNDNNFECHDFDKWTLENAVERYTAVTGKTPNADIIQSFKSN